MVRLNSSTIDNMNSRTIEDILLYPQIALWGAGYACSAALECIGEDRVSAIFDNNANKWGKKIGNIVISNPNEKMDQYINDCAFVISTNSYVYEIAQELIQKWNIPQERIFCTTNKILEECRYLPHLMKENRERILKIKECLADLDSKEYYMRFIQACYTRDPLLFQENPRCKAPYCYESDILQIGLKGGETILDCGAYNGDTARLFLKKTNNDCEIYCFEPVVGNCKEIRKWIENDNLKNVYVFNVGVGESAYRDYVYSTEEITMMGAVGSNRFRAKKPCIDEVQVDSLDNMMGNKRVDYIKMDIEGAEMAALKGARSIIEKNHPQMLISGYHRMADMWEIPELVLSIVPDYKVFLGHQPHAPFEPEFIFIK